MLIKKNPYTWAGLGLLITGGLVALFAHFILGLTWLAALGLCMVILGAILLALGRAIPKLPPEVCGLFLDAGVDNMATIVEELGIKARAVYLPSSLTNGSPKALIPLHANPALPPLTRALPQRFIARYGSRPDDIGLLFSTIGSRAVALLEARPDPTPEALEAALTALLAGTLDAADGTTVTSLENHLIKVEIANPRVGDSVTRCQECLGGPLASIVASVTAEAWDKPVTIAREEHSGGRYSIELEVTE
ncbi:MAG TPA: hypothetical protein G4O01_04880 [Dehalococcoidia bacterium]|nr:hypothetical protein [Dehalococcoidia bacterium]